MVKRQYPARSIYLLLSFILVFSACSESEDCCTIIDNAISLHFLDQHGNNLLNNTEQYDESNIKIYYQTEEGFEYIFNSELDYPNFHFIDTSGDKTILTVYASYFITENTSRTLITFNETISDTLVCQFDTSNNNEIVTRAWLNEQEITNRYIEIVR